MRDPGTVLAALPQLAGYRVLRRLASGFSSDSWLLASPAGKAVLRLDRPLAARLGLDRQAEWHILQHAHAAGLAPPPLLHDPENGVLVTGFVDGPAWQADDLRNPVQLERVGRLLRRVHDQPGVGAVIDTVQVAERYARAVDKPGLSPRLERVAQLTGQLYANNDYCLCHHDPHAGNVLGRERLWLLDWEYAARGQPLFDLAVVCQFHDLPTAARKRVMAAWQGSQLGLPLDELAAHCELYDLLAGLWELAVRPGRTTWLGGFESKL